ncbi:MAG: oligosaccharide repeat unit polymerase [Caldilineaceae bacterium]|nr:oligosaccharide repeat unit polymerase [Caldilineaceae bacterium]
MGTMIKNSRLVLNLSFGTIVMPKFDKASHKSVGFTERINRARPSIVLICSFVFVISLILASPVTPYQPETFGGALLIFSCVVSMLVGFEFGGITSSISQTRHTSPAILKISYRICFSLGALGVAARLADWIIFRNIDLGSTTLEIREALAVGGGGVLAIAAAGLLPFTYAPIALWLSSRAFGPRMVGSYHAIWLAMLGPAIMAITGSRSAILSLSLYSFFAIFLTIKRITILFISISFLAIIFLALAFFYIFGNRAQDFGMDLREVARYSVYTHLVPLDDWYIEAIDSNDGDVRAVPFLLAHLLQYTISGLIEFFYLYDHYTGDFTFGTYNFMVPWQLLTRAIGIDFAITGIFAGVPRVGTFSTFYGPAYVDFGWLSPLFCFAFALLIAWTRKSVLGGNILAFPLYLTFLWQLALAPIVNGILLNASVTHNIAFLALCLVGHFSRRPHNVLGSPALRTPHLRQYRKHHSRGLT